VPNITSSVDDGPLRARVVGNADGYTSEYAAHNVFDTTTSMWLLISHVSPVWVGYDFPCATRIEAYTIRFTNGDRMVTRAPRTFELQGGTCDGGAMATVDETCPSENWTTLDRRENETNWRRNRTRTYTVASPGEYRTYRLLITDDNSGGAGVLIVSIGNLELLSCATPEPTPDCTPSPTPPPTAAPSTAPTSPVVWVPGPQNKFCRNASANLDGTSHPDMSLAECETTCLGISGCDAFSYSTAYYGRCYTAIGPCTSLTNSPGYRVYFRRVALAGATTQSTTFEPTGSPTTRGPTQVGQTFSPTSAPTTLAPTTSTPSASPNSSQSPNPSGASSGDSSGLSSGATAGIVLAVVAAVAVVVLLVVRNRQSSEATNRELSTWQKKQAPVTNEAFSRQDSSA